MMNENKEWVRVAHAANGTTSVTVTLVEDNLSVKWSAKTYSNQIPAGLRQAREGAQNAMESLRKATAELEVVR